ncbi:hypothetical protein Tcan_09782 [Toxocara canis]|uniref:Uncharacterized protein n=1 Tax=Toxocara canis TaxID=6265 RepID=A0A0B2VY98_TOXCA|nr:hypothetical protein Tcan_09782 [Toxocara canis]
MGWVRYTLRIRSIKPADFTSYSQMATIQILFYRQRAQVVYKMNFFASNSRIIAIAVVIGVTGVAAAYYFYYRKKAADDNQEMNFFASNSRIIAIAVVIGVTGVAAAYYFYYRKKAADDNQEMNFFASNSRIIAIAVVIGVTGVAAAYYFYYRKKAADDNQEKEKKEELVGGVASAPSETGSSSKEAKEAKVIEPSLPIIGSLEPTQPLHSAEESKPPQLELPVLGSLEPTQPLHSAESTKPPNFADGTSESKQPMSSTETMRALAKAARARVASAEATQPAHSTEMAEPEKPASMKKEKKEELFGGIASAPSETGSSSKEAKEAKVIEPALPIIGSLEPTQPLHSAEESKPPQLELPMLGSLEPTQPLHSAESTKPPNFADGTSESKQLMSSAEEAETKKRAATKQESDLSTAKLATSVEKVSQKKDEKSPSLISPSYMNRPSPKVPPMSDTFCYCGAQSTISTTTFEGDLNDKVKVELLPTTVKPIVFDPYNPVDLTHRPGTSDMSAKCLKPVQRQANHRIIVPFLPVLHGITYASKHAQLLTELVENYEYFESNLLDSS